MKSTPPVQQVTNTILADKYATFTRSFSSEIPPQINTNQDSVPLLFRKYDYPVSSWPVILDQEMLKNLKDLSIKIPRLIRKIPSLYFENNLERIAAFYFEGNELVSQMAMMCHKKDIEIGARLDLSFTSEGFKVLEVNIGTTIGGWQAQSFESIIRKLHPILTNDVTADHFNSRNIQLTYVKFLVDEILQKVTTVGQEINIFIGLDHLENKDLKKNSLTFFNDLLKQELTVRGLSGQAYSGDVASLKLGHDGLFLDGVRVHSILTLTQRQEQNPLDVLRAFIMDKIYLPDHLGSAMYGDKRNLSLLRQLAEQNKFDPEDKALILNSIPWTCCIADSIVSFNKQEVNVLDLLRQNKEQFVIKAADGFQGKNVFVGKFLSNEQWEKALALALENHKFIAQEFSESLNFIAPNGLNQWTPHKLIWGAFGFGKKYGGAWVRMSEVNTDVGVINSATGAVEAIVYEYLT